MMNGLILGFYSIYTLISEHKQKLNRTCLMRVYRSSNVLHNIELPFTTTDVCID